MEMQSPRNRVISRDAGSGVPASFCKSALDQPSSPRGQSQVSGGRSLHLSWPPARGYSPQSQRQQYQGSEDGRNCTVRTPRPSRACRESKAGIQGRGDGGGTRRGKLESREMPGMGDGKRWDGSLLWPKVLRASAC